MLWSRCCFRYMSCFVVFPIYLSKICNVFFCVGILFIEVETASLMYQMKPLVMSNARTIRNMYLMWERISLESTSFRLHLFLRLVCVSVFVRFFLSYLALFMSNLVFSIACFSICVKCGLYIYICAMCVHPSVRGDLNLVDQCVAICVN